MEITRIQIIFVIGLVAFLVRAVPQMFFVGRTFPASWDRWLRYVSYALICSIIAVTLFLSSGRFDFSAATPRAIALALTILIAYKTKSAVSGMIAGAIIVVVLSRVW